MTPRELGCLRGTLLLFGGPCGNLQATAALRSRAERLGIAPGNIICTGDAVAYCAQPNETLALLREWGIHLLMGNCEESLAADAAECGCGFESGSACDRLAGDWYRYAKGEVSRQHKEWMGDLPRSMRFSYQNRTFAVAHGGLEQINQFIFPSTDEGIKLEQIHRAQADGIIAGHCGLPFTQVLGGKLWHNPGALGMPANDGTAHVWFSLWMPAGDRIRIEHHRLDYDAGSARQAMLRAGLVNGYEEALTTGLWPSMEVLPQCERRRRGQEISETAVLF